MDKIIINPKGVCSRTIEVSVQDDVIVDVQFYGGCSGNTQGVSALLKGMKVDEVISRLEGIKCGFRNTSCPNELAKGIKEYYKK
jgi:uncharacterized protein (TIGR03905 family)